LTKRRSVRKDIKKYLNPKEMYELINNSKRWNYKTLIDLYTSRDKALMSVLYLTGCRIGEVLNLRLDQLDFESFEKFIVIKALGISKRKAQKIFNKQTGELIRIIPADIPRIDFPLPRKNIFGKFTNLFLDYYNKLDKSDLTERVFPISRKRAWQIINHSTGLWCHYFRSQRLSFTINKVRSAIITAQMVGIKNPNTLRHYYHTAWEEHKDIYE